MRLIDADALKTKAETIQTIDCWHMRTEEQAVLVEHIDNAPTIDAVSVIRCKDCKWYQDNATWEDFINHCKWISTETPDEDDFCSCGERKNDD